MVRRCGQNAADTRAATMAALAASLLATDTATRAALSDTSAQLPMPAAAVRCAAGPVAAAASACSLWAAFKDSTSKFERR